MASLCPETSRNLIFRSVAIILMEKMTFKVYDVLARVRFAHELDIGSFFALYKENFDLC